MRDFKIITAECPGNVECDIYKVTLPKEIPNNYHLMYKDKVVVPVTFVPQIGFRKVVQASDLTSGVLPSDENEDGYPDLKVSDEQSELTSIGRENYKNYALEKLMSDGSDLVLYGSDVLDNNNLTFEDFSAMYFVHHNITPEEATSPDVEPQSTIYFKAFDNEVTPENFISTHINYSTYIRDSSNIVIQNLNIQGGRYNSIISRNSHKVKLIGNIYSSSFRNIYVVGKSKNEVYYAPSDILIQGNVITNNFSVNVDPQGLNNYMIFLMVKEILGDGHGVYLLNTGDNIEVKNNFLYNVANGIQSYRDNIEYNSENLAVHHNLIINSLDDALEPGGSCVSCKWYLNHIRNAAQAIRLKISDSKSVGPLYLFQNIVELQDKYSYDDDGVPFHNNQLALFYHTGTKVPIYIYNNSFFGSRCMIQPTGGNIAESGRTFI